MPNRRIAWPRLKRVGFVRFDKEVRRVSHSELNPIEICRNVLYLSLVIKTQWLLRVDKKAAKQLGRLSIFLFYQNKQIQL